MKRSHRELYIDMAIRRGFFKNNQIIRSSPVSPPKTGVIFYGGHSIAPKTTSANAASASP